ncbi:alpha/beta hydrolase family protein [Pseudoteredinibacter isoporae]|uniref:alpha/beta hydrolase family protein n=1 Tax=Pseudoteredinibacter isoporae TaxID=570281 RepID=UPI00310998CA
MKPLAKCWVMMLLCFSSTLWGEATTQVEAEAFAKLPRFSSPVISPNGRYLAAKMSDGNKSYVVMRDLQDASGKLTKLSDGKYYINWFQWANNERLLLSVRKNKKIRNHVLSVSTIGSVKRDGSDPIFYKAKPNRKGFFKRNPSLVSLIKNDPEHVLLVLDDSRNSWASPVVHKVNLESGKRTRVQDNPNRVSKWIADENGELKVGIRYEQGANGKSAELLLRNKDTAEWEVVQATDYFDENRIQAVRMKPGSSHILLVEGRGKEGLERYLRGGNLKEFDINTLTLGEEYQNDDYQRIKEDVEFLLADDKIHIVSRNQDSNVFVLLAMRSNKPNRYYVFDSKTGQLNYLASEYPHLDNLPLSNKQMVQYSARDSYQIPAYLSLPVGERKGKLPTVVLVHGGPHARDFAGFDPMVQMLNNRGYAVLQSQFRGSDGFGDEHRKAGMKQWGKRMQDDVADGVRWLVKEGIADKERVCIVGASYGGYAAAMGLANDPDLYRCGISINGVLDFPLLRRDIRDYGLYKAIQREGLNDDGEAENVSPVHQAKRISAPLLLFHVKGDAVAFIDHSRRMNEAMLANDKSVEYIELACGEHWRTDNKQEVGKFEAVDRFLKTHLAP